MSEAERQQARDRLASSILPIASLSRQLTAMLRTRSARECEASVASFFEGWNVALAAVERGSYYRAETARCLEDLYSNCALHALLALNTFTQGAGVALVEWMQRSTRSASMSVRMDFVCHFATDKKTGALAGRMASEVLKAIEAEDEVQHRSDLMARLARALLPANLSEAASLFSRGLSELDAIGSGDQSFTNELLRFASSLEPEPLRSEAAHRLAKICELNIYDSHKFPWPLVAAAFSRVWGGSYLAQIARWHDRGKVQLELTLPSAVSSLVSDQLMVPEEAIALLRLVDPVEFWDWGWNDLIESFIKVGSPDIAALLNELLDQFEFAYPCRPPASSLEKMRNALKSSASAFASVKERLERLEARASHRRQVESENKRQGYAGLDSDVTRRTAEDRERQVDAVVHSTDPLNAASIEALVDRLDEIDGALDAKSRAFKELRERVAYADQSKHIEAVVSACNLELFAKNELLEAIKADWLASSPCNLRL